MEKKEGDTSFLFFFKFLKFEKKSAADFLIFYFLKKYLARKI
jgi:hypothetical protein